MRAGPDPATLVAFLALVTIAGGNAPAIRYVSCKTCELDPFWGAAMRFLLATALFAVIAHALHKEMPRGRVLLGGVVFVMLQFGAGFGLIYWGLVRAPAGLGQVLIACVPLLTFGLALAHHQERFRWEGLVGAALAVGGIAVVFNSGLDAGVPLTSMMAILAGAVCWAEALIVVNAFPPVRPAAMNTIAMGVGTVVLLALSTIFGEALMIPESASTWAAQAYLVIAGSIGVFWLYSLRAPRLDRERSLLPARAHPARDGPGIRVAARRADYTIVRSRFGSGARRRLHRRAEAPLRPPRSRPCSEAPRTRSPRRSTRRRFALNKHRAGYISSSRFPLANLSREPSPY